MAPIGARPARRRTAGAPDVTQLEGRSWDLRLGSLPRHVVLHGEQRWTNDREIGSTALELSQTEKATVKLELRVPKDIIPRDPTEDGHEHGIVQPRLTSWSLTMDLQADFPSKAKEGAETTTMLQLDEGGALSVLLKPGGIVDFRRALEEISTSPLAGEPGEASPAEATESLLMLKRLSSKSLRASSSKSLQRGPSSSHRELQRGASSSHHAHHQAAAEAPPPVAAGEVPLRPMRWHRLVLTVLAETDERKSDEGQACKAMLYVDAELAAELPLESKEQALAWQLLPDQPIALVGPMSPSLLRVRRVELLHAYLDPQSVLARRGLKWAFQMGVDDGQRTQFGEPVLRQRVGEHAPLLWRAAGFNAAFLDPFST